MWFEDVKVKEERKKLEGSAETPGGAAETDEKSQLNSSREAEEKITERKTNYDVIITYTHQK